MDTRTYSVIDLAGEDAIAFANAQLSSDVRKLKTGQWQWSSWLDARGRVRALFLLVAANEQVLRLLLRGGEPETLINQLRMFVLRSRVNVHRQPDQHAVDHTPAMPMHTAQTAENDTVLGFGDYAVRLTAQPPATDAGHEWQRLDIERGFPWLPQAASGAFLAPSLSLRRLDATSLTKGCYPGQEIATRLHHRGGNKRHLCMLRSSQPIPPGGEIHQDEATVGMVLQTAFSDDQHTALAVLHERALPLPATNASQLHAGTGATLLPDRRFDD